MSVLQYINNRNRRFYTYVANRVAVIHEGSKSSDWRHIDGKVNPADIGSRGLKPYQIEKAEAWLCGPKFLSGERKNWPSMLLIRGVPDSDAELRKELFVYSTQVNVDAAEYRLLQRYS